MPQFIAMQPENPTLSLGLAVTYLMDKPAFAMLPFGEWSQILTRQIERRHFLFIIDERRAVRGFIGWALTSQALAEEWIEGRRNLSSQECLAGNCVVFNAYAAEGPAAHRFLWNEARKIGAGSVMAYSKRVYADGSVRMRRHVVNEFVEAHLRRNTAKGESAAAVEK